MGDYNEDVRMSDYQYTISGNTVQVIGHEGDLIVLDFGNWESGKISYYRSLLAQKRDMEYAEAYLNQMFFGESTSLIDGALINSAIQLLVKCFSNPSGKGRPNLSVNKVFRTYAKSIGEEDLTRQFSQFQEARNEVISHDQRDYSENIIGLVVDSLNDHAEDIVELTIREGFLYRQNHEILLRMVHVVLKYLNSQIEGIKRSLIEEYNQMPEKPYLGRIICKNIPMATAW